MNGVDVGIIALALLLGLSGMRAGFIVGSATLLALGVGAVLGSKIGPAVLTEGSESPYAALSALAGAMLVGAAVAIFVEGIARTLRERLHLGSVGGGADATAGAVLSAGAGVALAWLIGVVALNTPGLEDLREPVQRSAILSTLYEEFPASDSLINVLNEVDPSPALEGQDIEIAAPPKGITRDPDLEPLAQSVVRVRGTACGLGVAGSGWVGAPGLIVTNAHVIAGQSDTTVVDQAGTEYSAVPVAYKPGKDLAVLRVEGFPAPPINLATSPEPGTPAAILGFPKNGPYSVSAARFGQVSNIIAPDSYGEGQNQRRIAVFRGKVISGNSGGPLVNGKGLVLGTVFASAVGSDRPQGFAVPNILVRNALEKSGEPVGTGPCA